MNRFLIVPYMSFIVLQRVVRSMADFFWFQDEQWSGIEPLLRCDTRGMLRVDACALHCLKGGPFDTL